MKKAKAKNCRAKIEINPVNESEKTFECRKSYQAFPVQYSRD